MNFPVALDDDFIAFSPKKKLTQSQIKALLAYLNSSFGQFQVERKGRATGGGMLSLEVDYATNVPVPDVVKMRDRDIGILARAFENLEDEARRLGGADRRSNITRLQRTTNSIDDKLVRILGVPRDAPSKLRKATELMMERRVARMEEARAETIRGEESPRIVPPRKTREAASKEDRLTQPLEGWIR